VRSDKTIDGRGRDITIEGNLVLRDATNVIITDVGMTNELEGHCTQDGDVITIEGRGDTDPGGYTSRNIWINHVELFLGGDGLLDIKGGSKITISWCHLHGHKKAMLASYTQDDAPAPGMRVTFHHNYFERITLRGPQFIFGWAHYFNNYQFEWYEYGAGSLGGAQFYSENNIYQARPGWFCLPVPCPDPNPCGDNDTVVSKDALVTDWASNGEGYAISVGDLALEDASISENQPQDVFIPSDYYSYTAETATEELAARIAAESGPRVDYCQ
jgi:pectate lyase